MIEIYDLLTQCLADFAVVMTFLVSSAFDQQFYKDLLESGLVPKLLEICLFSQDPELVVCVPLF